MEEKHFEELKYIINGDQIYESRLMINHLIDAVEFLYSEIKKLEDKIDQHNAMCERYSILNIFTDGEKTGE